MFRTMAAVFACVLVIAAGVVHGFWTDRWRKSAEVTRAADRLNGLPLTLGTRGEWQGEEVEVTPGQAGAGVAGCIQRRYVNRLTGDAVALALVCGRPGPVSIHTPDVCYAASGYEVGVRRRAELDGSAATFWTADAKKTKAAEETKARIYWAWNDGKGWQAPDDPRLTFVRRPVLYKLYVLRELGSLEGSPKNDPCLAFLEALLPALEQSQFVTAP
jgi:hypothetical protein